MSTRAEALATQFEQANAAAIATVEACDDAAWRAMCEEGWPVGFTAWHIGDGHTTVMGLVDLMANAQPLPPLTAAMLDAENARNAAEQAQCNKQEALELLHQRGKTAAAAIRGFSDEQLDRTAALDLLGGATVSTQQVIEGGLIGHIRQHLASIQAAA